MSFAVRTAGDPTLLAGPIREASARGGPRIYPYSTFELKIQQADSHSHPGTSLRDALSFFSVLALLLACIGLYGVMSHAVTRDERTR
jgi:hypothetical protein